MFAQLFQLQNISIEFCSQNSFCFWLNTEFLGQKCRLISETAFKVKTDFKWPNQNLKVSVSDSLINIYIDAFSSELSLLTFHNI